MRGTKIAIMLAKYPLLVLFFIVSACSTFELSAMEDLPSQRHEELQNQLLAAIKEYFQTDDLNEVHRLIAEGASFANISEKTDILLMFFLAILGNNVPRALEVIELLVNGGIDVNSKFEGALYIEYGEIPSYTSLGLYRPYKGVLEISTNGPLLAALFTILSLKRVDDRGRIKILEMLLQYGANPNEKIEVRIGTKEQYGNISYFYNYFPTSMLEVIAASPRLSSTNKEEIIRLLLTYRANPFVAAHAKQFGLFNPRLKGGKDGDTLYDTYPLIKKEYDQLKKEQKPLHTIRALALKEKGLPPEIRQEILRIERQLPPKTPEQHLDEQLDAMRRELRESRNPETDSMFEVD
jgi:hypothetical protein